MIRASFQFSRQACARKFAECCRTGGVEPTGLLLKFRKHSQKRPTPNWPSVFKQLIHEPDTPWLAEWRPCTAIPAPKVPTWSVFQHLRPIMLPPITYTLCMRAWLGLASPLVGPRLEWTIVSGKGFESSDMVRIVQ